MLHWRHTGKLRPHQHTSWGGLLTLLGAVAAVLVGLAQPAAFAATSGSGNYQVNASVADPKPTTAPTITSLVNGQVYHNADSVAVAGACPAKTTVRIFKNEVLAGAAVCSGGRYSVPIDLFVGANTIVARAYASDDAVSPDSVPVSVSLQPSSGSLASTTQLGQAGVPANQFYLTSSAFQQGGKPGQALNWTITASGGQPPFAVSIDWGDGNTQLISRGEAGPFTITHSYARAASDGGYSVIIKATDQRGANAYLQLATAVGASGTVTGAIKQGIVASPWFRLAFGATALVAFVIAAFWLGEKRELHLLRKRGAAV